MPYYAITVILTRKKRRGLMAKLGRPFTYQSDTERPVTVSLRVPRGLYDRLARYADRHRKSITGLLLEGLSWRLEQGRSEREESQASPLYYGNTVLQELARPVHLIDECVPFDEDLAPTPPVRSRHAPEILHYDNTVIPEKETRRGGRRSTLRGPIIELLRAHPEGLSAVEIKVYLGVDKHIGDTLSGMMKNRVIRKERSGKTVRYYALKQGE
jgi:hypothetical protein